MSFSAEALRARLLRAAALLQPELNGALLRGIDRLLEAVPESAIVAALESGGAAAVVALFDEATIAAAFGTVAPAIAEAVREAAQAAARDLPRARELTGVFNVLNPRVVESVREINTKVMRSLTDSVRATVRQNAERGLVEGVNPRTSARAIRSVIGIGPTQEQQVQNYRRALEQGDAAKALTYAKRDRRFDGTVRKGNLSAAQIERMTDIYRKRRIALNAASVSRTAALDAVRSAQRLSWEAAADRGIVERDLLRKQWIATQDARTRDEHEALHLSVVGFDEAFANGEVTPGESTYSCRCVARYFQARPPRAA